MTGAVQLRRPATPPTRCRRRSPRRRLELMLDGAFRPGAWAARAAHMLGLQGRLRVSSQVVPTSRPRGAPPLRIGFASDFHAGPTTDIRLLERACRALDEARIDVLLLGGDFVSVRAEYARALAPLLASIRAPLGRFAVLGNHDLRADCDELTATLGDAGVDLLTNTSVRLAAPHTDVLICGLDDPLLGNPRADRALDGAKGTRIVLMHSPDGLLSLGRREFALALCGHTHGGQIALPGGRALVHPAGKLVRRYCQGRHTIGASTLIVSRGVGCSTIPVRLFAQPEVNFCVLRGFTDAEARQYR